MLFARVIGNVVATQKNQRYEGTRVMLCRQITPTGDDMEYTCIALDSVNSGEGDIVVIAQEGWSASTAATGRAVPRSTLRSSASLTTSICSRTRSNRMLSPDTQKLADKIAKLLESESRPRACDAVRQPSRRSIIG